MRMVVDPAVSGTEIKEMKELAKKAIESGNNERVLELIESLKEADSYAANLSLISFDPNTGPRAKFFRSLDTMMHSLNPEMQYASDGLLAALKLIEPEKLSNFCLKNKAVFKRLAKAEIETGYYDLAIEAMNIVSLCSDMLKA